MFDGRVVVHPVVGVNEDISVPITGVLATRMKEITMEEHGIPGIQLHMYQWQPF